MPSLTTPLLLLTSLTALLSMFLLAHTNGTFAYRATFSLPGAYLPNTTIPIQPPFKTGIARLDEYIAFMLSVFWVDLDARNVVAHIQGTHFLGTLSATWMLMVVEAHRVETSTSFLIATYVMETVGELVGLGFVTPLWCILQLWRGEGRRGKRTARGSDAGVLPFAFVVGHFVPTAMMLLADPAGQGLWSQQNWVLARLFHPLGMFVVWKVLRAVGGGGRKVVSLRGWYGAAIVVAVCLHAVALAPVVMLRLAPGWLDAGMVRQLDLRAIFVPEPFWRLEPRTVLDFAQGVSFFLQWDELLTGVAVFVWSSSYYFGSKAAEEGILRTWLYLGVLLLLGGPLAAAAYMMQEYDRVETERVGEIHEKTN